MAMRSSTFNIIWRSEKNGLGVVAQVPHVVTAAGMKGAGIGSWGET